MATTPIHSYVIDRVAERLTEINELSIPARDTLAYLSTPRSLFRYLIHPAQLAPSQLPSLWVSIVRIVPSKRAGNRQRDKIVLSVGGSDRELNENLLVDQSNLQSRIVNLWSDLQRAIASAGFPDTIEASILGDAEVDEGVLYPNAYFASTLELTIDYDGSAQLIQE